MRRVVTGHGADGQSTVISDELIDPQQDPLRPGFSMHEVWGADETLSYPGEGSRSLPAGQFPPVGGVKVTVVTFPPGHGTSDAPGGLGMHATDTTDVTLVIAGEPVLGLDDGSSVELSSGDTVVQHGTLHEWRNPSDKPCVLAVTLVGARRDREHA